MALPDYFKVGQGTSVEIGDAGDYTMTLSGLANGSGRQSQYVDLGATFEEEYTVEFEVECASAPTAGENAELYMVSATDTGRFPGGVSGSDAAWPADGNEDEWAKQLDFPTVVLNATNDGSGTIQTQHAVIWRPIGRYVVAVADNNLGVSLASNANSKITITPRQRSIVD